MLAELKTLRAKERLPELRPQNTGYDGQFEIPTFDEVLALRKRLSRELGRTVGVYPETKHPSHFAAVGLDLTPPLLAALHGEQDVFIQSFEDGNLRELHKQGVKWPLVQLLTRTQAYDAADVASYADGVGPDKNRVDKAFVDEAHAHGLLVHPYTFRAENQFLPADLRIGSDPRCPTATSSPRCSALRDGRRRPLHRQPRHRRRSAGLEADRVGLPSRSKPT